MPIEPNIALKAAHDAFGVSGIQLIMDHEIHQAAIHYHNGLRWRETPIAWTLGESISFWLSHHPTRGQEMMLRIMKEQSL
jgi:hypothetical protein